MTGPRRRTCARCHRKPGVEFDENLTKADAFQTLDELQAKTGAGDTLD